MKSKWFELKEKAINLRKNGRSIRNIEKNLKIPKATLSGWFKDITLNKIQLQHLNIKRLNGLIKARKQAVLWHNQQKELRLKIAEAEALGVLSAIDVSNKNIVELALAMLYLGEGNKTNRTGIGNSDPLILKFFISALKLVYNYDIAKIKCELHLRADQDPEKMRLYWSKELGIPLSSFMGVSIDKRTLGISTYSTYMGVCVLRCGNIALQRRLVYLSQKFCEKSC